MSTTITCTRRIEIDAGHRLLKHNGKCRNVHGHRYVFEITCIADINEQGMVIDFSKVKEVVGSYLDEKWDHGMILEEGDPLIAWCKENSMKVDVIGSAPTAERLASILLIIANARLTPYKIIVPKVRVCETPNCWAEAIWDEVNVEG